MWQKLLEEGAIEWDDISKKPTEFPPKQHDHPDYAYSGFVYKELKYDLHDVVTQIIIFLETEFEFKLKKPE